MATREASSTVFRQWFPHGTYAQGMGGLRGHREVQTHVPQGLWARGHRGRGPVTEQASVSGTLLVPPTDTGDPGFPNTNRQSMLDAFF